MDSHRPAELDPEALEVMPGVYLSASSTLVRRTLESAPDPGVRMVVGYAGWGAGQLDVELAQGAGCWRRSSRT